MNTYTLTMQYFKTTWKHVKKTTDINFWPPHAPPPHEPPPHEPPHMNKQKGKAKNNSLYHQIGVSPSS